MDDDRPGLANPQKALQTTGEQQRLANAVEWIRQIFVYQRLSARTLELGCTTNQIPRFWIETLEAKPPCWIYGTPTSNGTIIDLSFTVDANRDGIIPTATRQAAISIYKAIARRIWRRELSRKERVACVKASADLMNNRTYGIPRWHGQGFTRAMAAFMSWKMAWEEPKSAENLFDGRRLRKYQGCSNEPLRTGLLYGIASDENFSRSLRQPSLLNGQTVRIGTADQLRLMGRICLTSHRSTLGAIEAKLDPYEPMAGAVLTRPSVSVGMLFLTIPKRPLP